MEIFEMILIPVLGLLTAYVITVVRNKVILLQEQTENELADKYLKMLGDTIEQCVTATNQTYVNSLKEQGKFDAEAQKIAFKMTADAVMTILSEEAVYYISCFVEDIEKYVEQGIEATVNKNKGSL